MLDRTTPPLTSGFRSLLLPDFSRSTLPNGVELYCYSAGEEPVARIAMIWEGGLLDVEKRAALVMLGEMLAEGCAGLSGKQVSDILETNGALFRAQSSRQSTLITLNLLNHTAPACLPLLASIVAEPTFPADTLESLKQKEATSREITLQKPVFQANLLAAQTLYGAENPLAGYTSPQAIRRVDREDLVDVHRRLILGSKPAVFVSGKVDEAMLRLISDTLGRIPFGDTGAEPVKRLTLHNAVLHNDITARKQIDESLQTAVRIEMPAISAMHPHFDALTFTIALLGGYFGSRLMSNLREDKGYTYGVSAWIDRFVEGGSTVIACECDNRYSADVLLQIHKEIERLATEAVPEDELETVRNLCISELASVLESPLSIATYAEQAYTYGIPRDFFARKFRNIMALTSADVKQMARKYILDAAKVTALAGNADA